jgi:hypothetical protein
VGDAAPQVEGVDEAAPVSLRIEGQEPAPVPRRDSVRGRPAHLLVRLVKTCRPEPASREVKLLELVPAVQPVHQEDPASIRGERFHLVVAAQEVTRPGDQELGRATRMAREHEAPPVGRNADDSPTATPGRRALQLARSCVESRHSRPFRLGARRGDEGPVVSREHAARQHEPPRTGRQVERMQRPQLPGRSHEQRARPRYRR